MLLALDKHDALYIYESPMEAERDLDAIDVQQDAMEFCDSDGQNYLPVFTIPPKTSKLGPFGIVDIGAFRLSPQDAAEPKNVDRFLERAAHIEHTSVPGISTIEALKKTLRKKL